MYRSCNLIGSSFAFSANSGSTCVGVCARSCNRAGQDSKRVTALLSLPKSSDPDFDSCDLLPLHQTEKQAEARAQFVHDKAAHTVRATYDAACLSFCYSA